MSYLEPPWYFWLAALPSYGTPQGTRARARGIAADGSHIDDVSMAWFPKHGAFP
jgi:hypothetical protein